MVSLKKISPESFGLVLVQVVCLVIIALTGPWKCVRIEWQIWELSGAALAIACLVGLGRKSFSIFPEPKEKGVFVNKGVFAFIRHPMYAGILIICFCLVFEFPDTLRWISFGILTLVLMIKIIKEERMLAQNFPEYKEYQKQTNRLIPFIW